MYVKQMHIEVEQSTQKIAANKTRKLFPEEIDWLLNKNYGRFIASKVTPKRDGSGGFEVNAYDVDAIRPLLVTGKEAPALIADPRRVSSVLPGDYAYILSDESIIKIPTSGAPVRSLIVQNLLTLSIRKSTLGSGPFYQAFNLVINGSPVFDIQTYTGANDAGPFAGFNSVEQVYELVPLLIRILADQGWKAYWEYYGSFYQPKTLIIETGDITITGSSNVDGSITAGVPATYSGYAFDLPMITAQEATNRLSASNILQNLREVAFYKTQAESPLSELAGRNLYVYTNDTFIVISTRLSYVRKPKRISLILGTDCELADQYSESICDLTTEYFKKMIADPNWEVKMKDNLDRTPI